jgi:1-acyl-sn-glycerol-3-phosphate acyltransferase
MWKIFSVPCGSALYKFHCICIYIYVLAFSVFMPKVTLFYAVRVAGKRSRETEACLVIESHQLP